MLAVLVHFAVAAQGVVSAMDQPTISLPAYIQRVNRFGDNPSWPIHRPEYNPGFSRRVWDYSPIGVVQRVRDLKNDKNTTGRATAFYVGPCLVLTNYHVVYGDTSKPSPNINYDLKISMGVGKNTVFVDDSIIHPVMSGAHTNDGKFDYALLDDPKCLGAKYGWYPLDKSLSSADLMEKRHQVFVVGFPGDKTNMHVSVGYVTGVNQDSHNVLYSASEAPGDSGAPIFIVEDGRLVVVGLNVGGPKDDAGRYVWPSYSEERANEFFNTRDIFELWNDWDMHNKAAPRSPLDSAPPAIKATNLPRP